MSEQEAQGRGRAEWGLSSASRMVATFTDYDEPYAPYDGPAVQISVVGDLLFIYPGRLTEEVNHATFAHGDSAIGVDAEAFYEALGTMLRREDRSNLERAQEGKLPAGSPMRTMVPVVGCVPGVRKRA